MKNKFRELLLAAMRKEPAAIFHDPDDPILRGITQQVVVEMYEVLRTNTDHRSSLSQPQQSSPKECDLGNTTKYGPSLLTHQSAIDSATSEGFQQIAVQSMENTQLLPLAPEDPAMPITM